MSEQEAGPYCAFECPYTEEAHTAAYPDHDWTAPSPALTRDSDARICRRYFTGTVTLCKVHGHPSARCEDWEAGYRFASAGDKAEAPRLHWGAAPGTGWCEFDEHDEGDNGSAPHPHPPTGHLFSRVLLTEAGDKAEAPLDE